MESQEDKIKIVNSTFFQFSFFGMMNDTSMGRFKAYRGIKNIKDLGRLISFNGENKTNFWNRSDCDGIKGTDSTIFPPFNKENAKLVAYAPYLCRSFETKYVSRSEYNGVPISILTMEFGDLKVRLSGINFSAICLLKTFFLE
jgi:hypothetical protein